VAGADQEVAEALARVAAPGVGAEQRVEIGLVGRGPERYNLYLGAAFDGSRLGKLYADDVSRRPGGRATRGSPPAR
jgi:hypothetical protein